MESTYTELRLIVTEFSNKFSQIPDTEFSAKPNPTKWSKKEVVGHLIDSAQSNLRRFVVGQYEDRPNIVYSQDFWVQANGYNQTKKEDVIALWRLINQQIATVHKNMPKENYLKEVNTGKGKLELHTIEWLAADYVKHMKHHINQVIPNSFDITYP
jgi:DinB superfamily